MTFFVAGTDVFLSSASVCDRLWLFKAGGKLFHTADPQKQNSTVQLMSVSGDLDAIVLCRPTSQPQTWSCINSNSGTLHSTVVHPQKYSG